MNLILFVSVVVIISLLFQQYISHQSVFMYQLSLALSVVLIEILKALKEKLKNNVLWIIYIVVVVIYIERKTNVL